MFGLHLCKKILLIADNLSKTLQEQTLSAAEGQEIARLIITTLKGMRSSGAFDLFFELVERFHDKHGVSKPSLSRKRKAPLHLEVGTGSGYFSTSVQEHYCQIYYEVIDFVIAGITDRFDQPGYTLYKNVEDLLVKAVNNAPHDQCFKEVTSFYKDDLDPTELSTQLKMLSVHFAEQGSQVILQDRVNYLRSLSAAQRSFYSQVCILVRLILVMPATNAVSERSFSAMRRLKSYLHSTMTQSRLNHLMILHLNKEKLISMLLVTSLSKEVNTVFNSLASFSS